jgi:hypothetical protein
MAIGVPSTNTIFGPNSREALQMKSKLGAPMEIPGLFYNQYTPTAATVTSGTVTSNGQSQIGALQLGGGTATTLPYGGNSVVASITSSTGALVTVTTSTFMPTTLTYDQMPVQFTLGAAGVLPTNLTTGVTYYAQWVSGTTFKLAATPNGTVIPYVSDITGVVNVVAATQYWGSPWIPAGFLTASDSLGIATPASYFANGCTIRVEILGNALGTTTNVTTATVGLYSATGTWTALAQAAVARAAVGPYGYKITADLLVQQYNSTNAMIKSFIDFEQPAAAGTSVKALGLDVKNTSIDLTLPYAVDVRTIQATPVIGEYYEPTIVRMWAYN